MNFEANLNNSFDDDVELTSETDQGGVVIPKQTCEHVQFVQLLEELNPSTNNQCVDCENSNENWLCLSCGEIHCSRYINNHGEEHWLFTLLTDDQGIGHCLTISLIDLSVWCYLCKSYIKNLRLNPLIKQIELMKFGDVSAINENEKQSDSDHSVERKNTQTPSTIISIQDHSLLDELKKTDLLSHCYTIKGRSASIEELVCLHSSDYVNMIVSAEKHPTNLPTNRFVIQYNETTFSSARISAGMTIDVIQNVLNNHINGFILSASPGHRAFRDHGNDTSIYNNIALGINSVLIDKNTSVKRRTSLALIDSNNHVHMEGATPIENAICHMIHALTPASITEQQRKTPQTSTATDKNNNKVQVERVLVIDITSDHGSGIQSIYYESNQVFYISIHNETHQHRSSYHECGKNAGLGYTMNIPLSSTNTINDQDYINIMNELILPIAKEFQPELIVICVDFHIENLTALCYAWIIEQLGTINNSKLVVALDGDLSCVPSKISYVQTILSVLIGKFTVINNDELKNSSDRNLDVCQKISLLKEKHKQYWSCFQ